MVEKAAFVSCDIVSHARAEHDEQRKRVRDINELIKPRLTDPERYVWASGGDGGHLAFFGDGLQAEILELIRQLIGWADESDVELRIRGHHGLVDRLEGADGRTQLVGDGINVSGNLLEFRKASAVIVTEPFRAYMEQEGSLPGVTFKDARDVDLAGFFGLTLMLMSIDGEFSSTWRAEESEDRIRLKEAKSPWSKIRYAKRLLEIDAGDKDANAVLKKLKSGTLIAKNRLHPLLGQMTKKQLRRFIDVADLVERDPGTRICQRDDPGDTMFTILDGKVEVILEEGDEDRAIVMEAGEIVGEIALWLHRPRTASLQTVGKVAMLSIGQSVLRRSLASRKGALLKFFASRVGEYVCRELDCFPSDADSDDWTDEGQISFIELDSDQLWAPGGGNEFEKKGVYILVSGELEATERNVTKTLSGLDLPILFVDIPGHLVHRNNSYKAAVEKHEPYAIVLHIGLDALQTLDDFDGFIAGAKRALANQFLFDVFLGYTGANTNDANKWKDSFERAGFSVYMSRNEPGDFKQEIELAIRESLLHVPLLSTDATSGQKPWVEMEIVYRQGLFGGSGSRSNVRPIECGGGQAAKVADGLSAIRAEGDHTDAIEKVVAELEQLKSQLTPPFATARPAEDLSL